MMEIIRKVIANVLTAFYQPFWFAVILSVLFMFLYMFAKEHGWKNSFREWGIRFRTEKNFRRIFFLCFYTVMILFRTLLNRNMWENPLSNVIGTWGLHNSDGKLTTEILENIILFVPFTVLLMWAVYAKTKKKVAASTIVVQSTFWTFVFSICIEFLQLFLRLGTFQLSDLFFNTLGGLIGGLMYALYRKIKK